MADRVRRLWARHGRAVLAGAICLMAVAAVVWLGYEYYRLLWQPEGIGAVSVHEGANDLGLRFHEVQSWVAGEPVYRRWHTAVYPPATMLILWPLLGWLTWDWALGLWAAAMAIGLIWLSRIAVAGSGAKTPLEKIFVALIPLSMYAAGATIGNGQMILHVLPVLLVGVLLATRHPGHLGRDLLVAGLILFSLAKPTVSAPFFWIFLFVPARRAPAVGAAAGYVGLTVLAASFRSSSLGELFGLWIGRVTGLSEETGLLQGTGDLRVLLCRFGLEEWSVWASLAVLAGLGLWVYRRRTRNVWILLAVAGLVARLWTYHRWYDDLLVLPALVCLFRVARGGVKDSGTDVVAGLLLAASLPFVIAPGGLYLLPSPWLGAYLAGQTLTWLAMLVFLVWLPRNPGTSGAESERI